MNGAELPLWVTLPAAFLLVVGGLSVLIGGIGLLRLHDFYSRMHPPTMGTSLGTGCILIASMLVSSALLGRPVVHELLITLFVVVTTPVSAIILIRAALHHHRRETRPRRSAHAARSHHRQP